MGDIIPQGPEEGIRAVRSYLTFDVSISQEILSLLNFELRWNTKQNQ